MNFSYLNTIEDYVDAYKLNAKVNPLSRLISTILPCYVFPIVGIVLFFDIKSSGGTFAELSFVLLTDICFTLYFWLCLPKRIEKKIKKQVYSNSKLTGKISFERKLTLTEDKVLFSINDEKTEVKLEDIGYVTEFNGKIFIVSKFKTVVTIIPNTIFNSSINKNDFIYKITSKSKKRKTSNG